MVIQRKINSFKIQIFGEGANVPLMIRFINNGSNYDSFNVISYLIQLS